MNFSPNKTLIEIIKKVLLEVLILETFILVLVKEFVQLKNIDAKFYGPDYYDVNVNMV